MAAPCRLCGSEDTTLLYRGDRRAHLRDFLLCGECDLVFVPDEFLVSPERERERYLKHNNDPADAGYRAFLGRLLEQVIPLLSPGAQGLDYGCGPIPALVEMLREGGLQAVGYDLYFAPDPWVLENSYDFITCAETAEHFREPLREFERMARMLRPGGVLGVMTSMCPDPEWTAYRFERLHYITDETHICFYSARTMQWLAQRFGWELSLPRRDVAIFTRPGRETG